MARGGPPPEQQLAQLGQLGLGPGASPPGLLQMAMGGGGGGEAVDPGRGGFALPRQAQAAFTGEPSMEGFMSDPALNEGAPYRAITSPDDQNWSDLQGRPIHMGGPAPKFIPGTTFGGYNAVFDERAPSKDAGYFTLKDYFKDAPEGTMDQPKATTSGSGNVNNNALSTNNWRLLPSEYRTPDHFMINGQIISRAQARRDLAPKSVLGQESNGFYGYFPQGAGVWSWPYSSYGWQRGYIGGDQWGPSSTPTY